MLESFSTIFFLLFHLAIGRPRCPKKLKLDSKMCFQKTFYIKCINVTIDSIGPSVILRSIFYDVQTKDKGEINVA